MSNSEYLTGEQPRVGDSVEHHQDGDRGTVTEVVTWPGLRSSLTVRWDGKSGPWSHFPDELRLICRES
jgi:hypothetical protein